MSRPRVALLLAVAVLAGVGAGAVARRTPDPVRAPLEVGFQGGQSRADAQLGARLGARLVRVEWDIGTPAAALRRTIAAYAARGARVLPLAGFYRRLPSPAEARNLASWARAYGPGGTFWAHRQDGDLAVQRIEFGNETSYGYQYGDDRPTDASYVARAQVYAARALEAATAIRAADSDVGLLVQGDDGDTGSPVWVRTVLAAAPALRDTVAGWTIHPYGPRWLDRVARMQDQLAASGVAAPDVYVTEWGLATDGGRCLTDNYGYPRCMGYHQAARTVTATLTGLRARLGDRLRAFVVYALRDGGASGQTAERENYFGAFHSRGAVKGAYTRALRALARAGG